MCFLEFSNSPKCKKIKIINLNAVDSKDNNKSLSKREEKKAFRKWKNF